MNKIIEYVRCVCALNHEWNIDGKKMIITYFSHNYRDELSVFIDKLENRLQNRNKLITNEDKAIHGKRWNIPNALELSAVLFPNLTTDYVNHFIELSIDKKNEFGNASMFRLIIGTKQNIDKSAIATFLSIMHREQIRKMKELGIFKYAFRENIPYEYEIDFVEDDIKNFSLWRINGRVARVIGFCKDDSFLMVNICYEVQKRLENNEPILEDRITCYPIKMGKKNIAIIAGDIFSELTKVYIEQFMEREAKHRNLVGITYFYSVVFSYNNMKNGYELDGTNLDIMLRNSLKKYNLNYLDKFVKSNFSEAIKGDLWKLYQKKEGTSYESIRLDFSSINKPLLKTEIKSFIKDELINSNNYNYPSYSLRKLQLGLTYILSKFSEVNSCVDINVNIVRGLRDYLQIEAKKINGSEKLTVSTQAKIMQKFKQLFDYLMNNDELAITKPKINPFVHVSYHNLENMEKKTPAIPDEIVEKILNYICEIEPIYQRVLLISLNTGLRFKEISHLDENNLFYDKGNKAWKLEYIPWKILEKRRQQELDDYSFVVIEEFLVKEIKDQIRETKELREELNTNKIFLKENKEERNGIKSITTINALNFNKAINETIKKHKITDNQGKLWKFTHKQCRKTLAVDMITSGMSSQEVSYQLGHLSYKTTEKYYSEVRKYKLADMNSEFFKKKFKLLITEEQLSNYTEEERKLLYIGFCTDYREVELGKCGRPFSEGECKRSGEESCATCDKLCISYDNIPKWERLYKSKERTIDEMRFAYANESIDEVEYSQFREYQKELHLYNAYKDVYGKLRAEGVL